MSRRVKIERRQDLPLRTAQQILRLTRDATRVPSRAPYIDIRIHIAHDGTAALGVVHSFGEMDVLTAEESDEAWRRKSQAPTSRPIPPGDTPIFPDGSLRARLQRRNQERTS